MGNPPKTLSKSVKRRLAIQKGNPAGEIIAAALPRHEEVDLLLRQSAQRLEMGFLDFCELAQEAIEGKYHERFGFLDESGYFTERIGVPYRTLRRRLAVLEGLRKLPAGQIEAAKQAVAAIGSHKSSILAPVLGRDGQDWQTWVALAQEATEEALQDLVSSELGLRPRGNAKAPGEKFLAFLLNSVPPERRDQVEWVFRKMASLDDTANPLHPMAVFIQLTIFGEQELAARGIYREET